MNNCKSEFTPLVAHFKLSVESCPTYEEEVVKMSHLLYSSVADSPMYAMVCTRLDLSYAVSMSGCYMHNPSKDNWKAIKWILHYVKGSLDRCLIFDKSKTATYDVTGFVDSNYGRDLDRRLPFLATFSLYL